MRGPTRTVFFKLSTEFKKETFYRLDIITS